MWSQAYILNIRKFYPRNLKLLANNKCSGLNDNYNTSYHSANKRYGIDLRVLYSVD